MGSLYPIVLSTLQGYSDDLLQWYFDQGNNEMCANEHQHMTESDSAQSIDEAGCSSKNTQVVDRHNNCSSYLEGISNKGVINPQEINRLHQSSVTVEGEVKGSFSHENITPYTETTESNTFVASDERMHFEQSTSSEISYLESGVLTMFELNPAAQKLLPNLVVGMKYKRRNSKVPELFINEDDSFVSLPK